jgi:hypothetical protein
MSKVRLLQGRTGRGPGSDLPHCAEAQTETGSGRASGRKELVVITNLSVRTCPMAQGGSLKLTWSGLPEDTSLNKQLSKEDCEETEGQVNNLG